MKKTLTAVLLTTGLILGGAQSASAGIIVTNPTELAKQVEQLQQMAQQLEQLLKTVARIAFCQFSQHVDHGFITPGIGLIKIHRPAQR